LTISQPTGGTKRDARGNRNRRGGRRLGRRAGDLEVKAGLLNCWAQRRNWRATVRWYMEGLAMMNTERFERAADFLDEACRADVPQ